MIDISIQTRPTPVAPRAERHHVADDIVAAAAARRAAGKARIAVAPSDVQRTERQVRACLAPLRPARRTPGPRVACLAFTFEVRTGRRGTGRRPAIVVRYAVSERAAAYDVRRTYPGAGFDVADVRKARVLAHMVLGLKLSVSGRKGSR